MSIRLSLVDPINELTNIGFRELVQDINRAIRQRISRITNDISIIVERSILSQPEINQLLNYSPGGLAAQLGLYPGQGLAAAESIVRILRDNISYNFQQFDQRFNGRLEFIIGASAVDQLLQLPVGHVIYGKGDLHWLQWLLERGDSIIISSYSYNPKTGIGRSGGGNMVIGGSFRIPPQFAGTEDNNFISRALSDRSVERLINESIIRNLRDI